MTMVAPGYRATASAPRGSLGTTVSSRRSSARMEVNGKASSAAAPVPSMASAVSLLWNRLKWVSYQGPTLCTCSLEVPLTLPGFSSVVDLEAPILFCPIPLSLPSLPCPPLSHLMLLLYPHLQEVAGTTVLLGSPPSLSAQSYISF